MGDWRRKAKGCALAWRFSNSSRWARQRASWVASEAMETARFLCVAVWALSALAACALAPSAVWAGAGLALALSCAFPQALLALKPASWPKSEPKWGGFEGAQWAPMALFMSAPWALSLRLGCERLAGWGFSAPAAAAVWLGLGAGIGGGLWLAARAGGEVWRARLAWDVWRDPGQIWSLACEEPARARRFWMGKAVELGIPGPKDGHRRFEVCWRLSARDCAQGLERAARAGFDVDQPGSLGGLRWRRPVLAACQSGSESALRWLLKNGAALSHPLDACSLVCVSAMDGALGCLRACLESGGDCNDSQGGRSALEWALACGKLDCAWALFDAGAKVGPEMDSAERALIGQGALSEPALASLMAMRDRVALEGLLARGPGGRLRRGGARI